jgi:hypothetical protein
MKFLFLPKLIYRFVTIWKRPMILFSEDLQILVKWYLREWRKISETFFMVVQKRVPKASCSTDPWWSPPPWTLPLPWDLVRSVDQEQIWHKEGLKKCLYIETCSPCSWVLEVIPWSSSSSFSWEWDERPCGQAQPSRCPKIQLQHQPCEWDCQWLSHSSFLAKIRRNVWPTHSLIKNSKYLLF